MKTKNFFFKCQGFVSGFFFRGGVYQGGGGGEGVKAADEGLSSFYVLCIYFI